MKARVSLLVHCFVNDQLDLGRHHAAKGVHVSLYYRAQLLRQAAQDAKGDVGCNGAWQARSAATRLGLGLKLCQKGAREEASIALNCIDVICKLEVEVVDSRAEQLVGLPFCVVCPVNTLNVDGRVKLNFAHQVARCGARDECSPTPAIVGQFHVLRFALMDTGAVRTEQFHVNHAHNLASSFWQRRAKDVGAHAGCFSLGNVFDFVAQWSEL